MKWATSGLDTAALERINPQGRCYSLEILYWMDGLDGVGVGPHTVLTSYSQHIWWILCAQRAIQDSPDFSDGKRANFIFL
jgi:hypothetical protein